MNTVDLICVIGLAAVILALIIYSLIVIFKNGLIKKIKPVIKEAIRYAEKNIEGSSAKLQYVLTKVEEECNKDGLPVSLTIKLTKKLVNIIIEHHNIIDHDE